MTSAVGVLTFHRCINYGSYWQSRCLVEGLRRKGWDAVLLDHVSPQVDRAEWRCALRPHQPHPTLAADRRDYAAKTRKFFRAWAKLPRSAPFGLDEPEAAGAYDAVVVGSDEVWNLAHPWYARRGLFFGLGLRATRLASYAASFGNHDASCGLEAPWREGLQRFDAISVRDDNSQALIEGAVEREAELVLDPCLQFPLARRADRNGEGGYLALYGHTFPDWFAARIRRWARTRGMPIVSIGYRNAFADEQRIAAGPEEFAELMGQASVVATCFFHGCVFALLNDKPFVCVSSDYRSNKIRSLTAVLGASERLVDQDVSAPALDDLLTDPPGGQVQGSIEALRRRSDAFLDHALA